MKINDLNREGLLRLLKAYDKYIIDKCNDEQDAINNPPVCIEEFFDCEFEEMNEGIGDYMVNFNVFSSKIIEAVSVEDAAEKFQELSMNAIMKQIEYDVFQGGLDIGTIEKIEFDTVK